MEVLLDRRGGRHGSGDLVVGLLIGCCHRRPRRSRVPLVADPSGMGGRVPRGRARRPAPREDGARRGSRRPRPTDSSDRRHARRTDMANASLKRVLVGRPLAQPQGRASTPPEVPRAAGLLLGRPVVERVRDRGDDARPRRPRERERSRSGSRSRSRSPRCSSIVVVSYRQTVRAYPGGGGSYIVAHDNLGTIPGLIAAAALAGRLRADRRRVGRRRDSWRSRRPFRRSPNTRSSCRSGSWCCVTLANLRGVKEAGVLFAVPTYGFVAMVYVLLGARLPPMPRRAVRRRRRRTSRSRRRRRSASS